MFKDERKIKRREGWRGWGLIGFENEEAGCGNGLRLRALVIVLWLAAVDAQSLRIFKNIYLRWLYVLGGESQGQCWASKFFSEFFSW